MDKEYLAKLAALALEGMTAAGAEKAECTIEREKRDESNALGHREYLTREYENYTLTLKSIIGKRYATVRTNRTDEAGILCAAKRCVAMTHDALESEKLAVLEIPGELKYALNNPSQEQISAPADTDKLYKSFVEFMNDEAAEFPDVYYDCMVDCTITDLYYANTDGQGEGTSRVSSRFGADIAARTGDKVSGGSHIFVDDLSQCGDMRIMDMPGVRAGTAIMLTRVDPKPLDPSINIETVVFSPVWGTIYLDEVMRILRDELGVKPGKKVFENGLTYFVASSDKPFEPGQTDFSGEDISRHYLIRDGALTANDPADGNIMGAHPHSALSLSASNSGGSYDEFIKGIRSGVLVDFVSGAPADRYGNFTGVIKNGVYIENGEVKYPLCAVLIRGNLVDMFTKHIQAISGERSKDEGGYALPWIALGGASVR